MGAFFMDRHAGAQRARLSIPGICHRADELTRVGSFGVRARGGRQGRASADQHPRRVSPSVSRRPGNGGSRHPPQSSATSPARAAIEATSMAGRPATCPVPGTAITSAARLRRNCAGALPVPWVRAFPANQHPAGASEARERSAIAAERRGRPPSGLCPPSSQSSAPSGRGRAGVLV